MLTKLSQRRNQLSSKLSNQWLRQMRHLSDETSVSSFTASSASEVKERADKRPVNYIPDHLGQCRKWQRQKPWWRYRYFININPVEEEASEWSEEPEYPPLGDSSRNGIKKQIRMEWYEAIKRLPTAQQKEYEISKHYRHLAYLLAPIHRQYNSLPLQQYVTRTHLISGRMPDCYDQIDVDSILDNDLKQTVLDSIAYHLFETKQRRPSFEIMTSSKGKFGADNRSIRLSGVRQQDIIEDVISGISRALHSKYEHLSRMQRDPMANVVSSWWLNDYPTPFTKKSWFPYDTLNQQFTYKATHCLHLRSDKPLPPAISPNEDICRNSEIPEYKHRLINLGYPLKRHSFAMLPGFWSDHSYGFDFPNLICHSREGLPLKQIEFSQSYNDIQETLDGMAIISSFSWLNSMASNLGFSIYHELTYPLVTHVVITDGQFWSFYVYQLNTHSFHSDVNTNSLRNLCWSSGDLKLFEEYQNGRLIGVNEDVLKLLVKFLVRTPEVPLDCNLRPYLSEDIRSDVDVQELSYVLRRVYSNYTDSWVKKRQQVHLWEKIYKYHKDASPVLTQRSRPKIVLKYPPFFTK